MVGWWKTILFSKWRLLKKKKCPVEMIKITITKRNNTVDIPKQKKIKKKKSRHHKRNIKA